MKNVALVKCRNGIWQAFEKAFQRKNINPTLIDVFNKEDLDLLFNNKWDALVWTAKHTPKIKDLARKIIYLFDQDVSTKVFPNWNSYWHYDDKVSQYFLFTKYDFPIPATNVFFSKKDAFDFFENTNYPVILKSAHGAGSTNVSIIKSKYQALKKTNQIFGKGLRTFFKGNLQKGYLLVQDFAKNNSGDYRLVCYGDEILGFFRENRDNEPLASGSKKFLFKEIPVELLTIVYDLSQKMNYPVMSYDLIKGNDSSWIVTEISVIYGEIQEAAYNKAKVYKINNEKSWIEVPNPLNHYERMADSVLKSWNYQ